MVDYTKYFPLRTANQVIGAYDFLVSEGFGEECDCIKREGYNPNTRRLMVVGLLYDKLLVSKFLNLIWTQGDLNYRRGFLEKYKQRFDKRPALHVCWH